VQLLSESGYSAMLHINAAMTASYDEEMFFSKHMPMKDRRGRAPSDDLSTAAPSPEASPDFGPQKNTPLLPDDLLLPDDDIFLLPDAPESLSGSDTEFELSGCGEEDTCNDFELTGLDETQGAFCASALTTAGESSDEEEGYDSIEDTESELLDLLSELAALRADSRQQTGDVCGSGVQKIPYPELEGGFLPSQFMPGSQSWLLPAGRAETGQWAQAMAPRPGNCDDMQPLNIVLGEGGAYLEVASAMPDQDRIECERKRSEQAKAVCRRRRGRSRSPLVSMEDMLPRGVPEGSPRGRPRFWTR